jgi:hypothetical protein
MVGYILGAIVLAYTIFIIYKKVKDAKAGKSCCSGCDSCQRGDSCQGSDSSSSKEKCKK